DERADQRALASEVIDEDDLAGGTTDAPCFLHHPDRIGYDAHDMERRDVVEAVRRKGQIEGIHLSKRDVPPPVLSHLLGSLIEHVLGQIDPDDFAVYRVRSQRKPSADADFED